MLQKKINTPSFLIKNINYNELYITYKNGYFNRPIPDKVKLKLSKPAIINQSSNVVYDNFKTVELSGGKYAKLYMENNIKMGGICNYCNHKFESEIIGYPLAYEEKTFLNKDNIYEVYHLFWIEGTFDSYECCLSYCQLFHNIKSNIHYDIVLMLKYMYALLFNNAEIKPTNDKLLLIEHGGTMTHEDWSNKDVQYVKSHNVIKIPAQVGYFKK